MRKSNIISPITKDEIELVEIYKFDVKELKRESYEKMLYVGEVIEEKAKEILKGFNINLKTRNFYAYILREIMRNVPEHSESKTYNLACYKIKMSLLLR